MGYGDICGVDPDISSGADGCPSEAFVAGLKGDEIVIGREATILGGVGVSGRWSEGGEPTLKCSLIQSTLLNMRGRITIVGFV